MGLRGPGATPKPKPPKKANGRPAISVAQEVYDALRQPTLRAIKVLDALLESPDERTQLLAAKALVELGSKPAPPKPVDEDALKPKPTIVTVRYADGDEARASTG